jgi:hypothetical protein
LAWIATLARDPGTARRMSELWMLDTYPVFKRLALYAATQDTGMEVATAIRWLLSDDGWWLYAQVTARESMELLRALARRLPEEERASLEVAVMRGPPRALYREDLPETDWVRLQERHVWEKLERLRRDEVKLSAAAVARVGELREKYPDWALSDDGRENFAYWMDSGNERSRKAHRATPRTRSELCRWILAHPDLDRWADDDWGQRCRKDVAMSAAALFEAANQGQWPRERWSEALRAWSADRYLRFVWRFVAPCLVKAPDDVIQVIAWWIKDVAKTFSGNEPLFFALVRRVLDVSHEDIKDTDEMVNQAINHPIGYVVEGLIDWWYRQGLNDDQGLRGEMKELAERVLASEKSAHRTGRLILGANVISLFRVDREWTVANLLPKFRWGEFPVEARYLWAGFLWSPRLYRPLLVILKDDFLGCAQRYEALGDLGRQFASLMTFVGLDPADLFTEDEIRVAIRALPAEGIAEVAASLARSLDGSEGKREDYWSGRVKPFIAKYFPKDHGSKSDAIGRSFAEICIDAGTAFSDAFEVLKHWVRGSKWPDREVEKFIALGECKRDPVVALDFLTLLVADGAFAGEALGTALLQIGEADPSLKRDSRYTRLAAFVR